MVDVVRRDLEDLLNTRQSSHGVPAEFDEVQRSIVAYGMPDLTSRSTPITAAAARGDRPRAGDGWSSSSSRGCATCGPRWSRAATPRLRTLRFRIDARLRVDPAPEVAFDTVLELTSGLSAVRCAES